MCLTEEDSGLLMSSVCSCCMYWREEGEKGASMESGRGTEMGQLTLGKRKARIGIHNYVQGATIPRKGIFLL